MSYIEDSLMPGEKLVYNTKPHWIVFYPGAVLVFFSLFFFIFGSSISLLDIAFLSWPFSSLLGLCFLAIGGYTLINNFLMYHYSEYGITDKRILMKTGFIQRQSLELFLDKVESIKVDQSLLGRLLNFGGIIVVGTGGSHDRFFDIEDPLKFRKKTQETLYAKR